jgi:DNA-directed RNA polymerase specialized sigma24 family protein
MSPDGSVTHWLGQLRAGDRTAARHLWERYFRLLVSRARAALANAPRRVADEEDVALSAFDSFCRGAEQGRFPNLDDRDDLWRLLLRLTDCKAAHLLRDQNCLKRGGGKVVTEADLVGPDAEREAPGLEAVIGAEPTPELAASVAEEYRRLLDGLGDNELRSIAVWQMEGHTVEEIAAKMGRSARTVARKLVVIRERWLAAGRPS